MLLALLLTQAWALSLDEDPATPSVSQSDPSLATWQRSVPPPPQPLVLHYIMRHRELMVQVSAGRRASPAFRSSWAQLDAYWAFAQNSQPLPYLSMADQQRAADLSAIAATLAAEALLNETLARSEFLSGAQVAMRTLTGPNIEFQPSKMGSPKGGAVRANGAPPNRAPQLQAARLELPAKRRKPPAPSLRFGAGTALNTDPEQPLSIAWNTYLILSAIGVDDLRLSSNLVQLQFPTGGGRGRGFQPVWSLAWQLNLRHRIHPRLTLSAELRSVDAGYMPRQARVGLSTNPMAEQPQWVVALGARHDFKTPNRPVEQRIELRLQWNGRWRAPLDPKRVTPAQRQGPQPWWTPSG